MRCEISREALDDHFRGDNRDKLEVFRANRQVIEREARQKYLAAAQNRMGLFSSAPATNSVKTISAVSASSRSPCPPP